MPPYQPRHAQLLTTPAPCCQGLTRFVNGVACSSETSTGAVADLYKLSQDFIDSNASFWTARMVASASPDEASISEQWNPPPCAIGWRDVLLLDMNSDDTVASRHGSPVPPFSLELSQRIFRITHVDRLRRTIALPIHSIHRTLYLLH